MKSVIAFKRAVIAALLADSGVTALVGQKVFDITPQKTDAPYVYLGPVGVQRAPEDCGAPTWNLRMRLYAASTRAGRNEVWQILDAMDAALDGKILTMPTGTGQVLAIQTILGGDIVDPTTPTQTYLDLTATVAG